uniref:non-specific serine/threonine protein kinase n=1 Tax=Sinocyclocheilus rhinocerous TaxID=307959 RepID=A0A673G609_9TELE
MKAENTLNTFCGSPPYAAPELFRDEHYIGVCVDIWALGVMLFFMVTGTMPFRAETVAKLKRCILDGTYTVPTWVPDPCQKLIRGILQPQPSDRYTPGELEEHEIEVRNALEALGITADHIRNNQGKDCRSSITGV